MLKGFMRFCYVTFICVGVVNAQPWVMFNDMDDTYLYDQASGQVYIRVKKGGKNYEDTFVKMGVQDSIKAQKSSKPQQPQPKPQAEKSTTNDEEQKKLLQQAQELQRSIQGAIFTGE